MIGLTGSGKYPEGFAMGDYDNLDKFTLAKHGDRWEQRWAALLQPHFPAYEVFWRRYIVPLTNRIDPSISTPQNADFWIRLRDPVRDVQEQLAMSHFSVFYYLARATARIHEETAIECPEDIFALLDACGDNVRAFFKSIRKVLEDFGYSIDFLPFQKKEMCTQKDLAKLARFRGAFVEVEAYRDTILHNPVLGRIVGDSGERLPERQYLKQVQKSWKTVENLPANAFVDTTELFSRLHGEITAFLQEKWTRIIEELDGVREQNKFKQQWSLEERFLPIRDPEAQPSTFQAFAASGTTFTSASSTATLLVNHPKGRSSSKQGSEGE
jgi:hypothetical protein